MIVLFLALMGCSFTGDVLHEYLGVTLFALFAVHHVWNGRWYRSFGRGRYSLRRGAGTVVNLLLGAAMIGMAVSSVLVSRTVFALIDHDGGVGARQFHQAMTHAGWILAAIHTGFYADRFIPNRFLTAQMGESWRSQVIRFSIAALLSAAAVYGIWASFRHDVGEKLLMRQAYSFWDGPRVLYFADYLAIFVLYAGMARFLTQRLGKRLGASDRSSETS